jgi:hypothetical protein
MDFLHRTPVISKLNIKIVERKKLIRKPDDDVVHIVGHAAVEKNM